MVDVKDTTIFNKRSSLSYKVVAHQPWRRPVVVGVTCLIGVFCLVLGYALGNDWQITERVSSTLLSKDVEALEGQVSSLESQLIDAELNADVQREASNALREDLSLMRNEVARLEEEVTFYKSLMAPGSLAEGLHISEFDVRPTQIEQQFAFELLLTQVALRRSYIGGAVRLDVIGHYDLPNAHKDSADKVSGDKESADKEIDEAVLSLTELSELSAYPVKFRFRYFQDVAGLMTLPEGFQPDRVLVTANQTGKDALQVTFPWPAL